MGWKGRNDTTRCRMCARRAHKNFCISKSIFQVYRFFKGSGENNSLLDLGCGNGLFTVPLTNIFKNVVGVDISKIMIKCCKEKRNNLNFIVASGTELPFRDHVFDSILSSSVLQHLRTKKNVEKVLEEIARTATNSSFIYLMFWDTNNSPKTLVKALLKREKFKLKESPTSRLSFLNTIIMKNRFLSKMPILVKMSKGTKYVRLKGSRTSTRTPQLEKESVSTTYTIGQRPCELQSRF